MLTHLLQLIKVTSLIILVAIGLWLRFWHLGLVPAAFYHDELDHVATAPALLRWGTDLSGFWSPWYLVPLQTINWTGELPSVFHAIVQFFVGSTPAAARLTNALFGLATVVTVGFLTALVTQKKTAGLLASLLMLLNPWHIHISRLAYESTISLFFQVLLLIGLLQLLPINQGNATKTPRLRVWLPVTLPSSFFAYYTYHGAKFTVFVTLLCFLGWWIYHQLINKNLLLRSKSVRIPLLLIGTFMLFALHSLWVNHNYGFGNRSVQDVSLLSNAATQVDSLRKDRIPLASDSVIINKITISAFELMKRYYFVFDTFRLLVTGYEGTHQFSLITSGYFTLLDLLGLLLFIRFFPKKPIFSLIVLLILTTPIATVITGYQAILRSSLTYTLLLVCAGAGLHIWLNTKRQPLYYFLIFCFLTVSSIWFGLNYFGRYPLVTAESHMVKERLLARYARSITGPLLISVDDIPSNTARSLIYYNQWYNRLTGPEREQFHFPFPATLKIGEITVTTECPTNLTDTPIVMTNNKWITCGLKDQYKDPQLAQYPLMALPSPLDNGAYYILWRNPLCYGFGGNAFIHLQNIHDLNVEPMSDSQFCHTWVNQHRD